MRKRYIPAFVLEGIATLAVAINTIEMLAGEGIWEMRPCLWATWMFITITTLPAFVMWMLERRR